MTKNDKNVTYVFNEQVASMQQIEKNQGPIRVDFANGTPTAVYDLVVACDGATSRTRAMGLGCGVQDYIKPTNCWGAYFSIEQDLLEGSKTGNAISAVGGRCVSKSANLEALHSAILEPCLGTMLGSKIDRLTTCA